MDLKSRFQSSWRVKFTKQPPPSLLCFSKGSKSCPRMENLRQSYEQCKCNITSLQNQLAQEHFIESFLKKSITEIIESRENLGISQPKDGPSPETEQNINDGNGENSEMIENIYNNGIGVLEIVNNDDNKYVRVTSFKSSSTRLKKEKISFLRRKKCEKPEISEDYETIAFPLETALENNEFETSSTSRELSESNIMENDVVADMSWLNNMGNSSEDSDICDAIGSKDKIAVHKKLSETSSVTSSCSTSSCKMNIGTYEDDIHESPSISHVTTATDVEVKKKGPNVAPKPPSRKLKYPSAPQLPSSDKHEESCDTLYDNVAQIYVKPRSRHSDKLISSTESGRVPLDTDIDVSSGHGGLQKVNGRRQDSNENICLNDNHLLNNESQNSQMVYHHDESAPKAIVRRHTGDTVAEKTEEMRKFRLKSAEQECVVGTSFRKIDRINSEDTNAEETRTRLQKQSSTESYDSIENDIKETKNRKITPEIAAVLLKENSMKCRPNRRSIPHYENWSFHSALTRPDISIIDQDFNNEYGSEDDNVSVTSSKSRDSALSDDVIHSDMRRPSSESDCIKMKKKTTLKEVQITDEDVYYIEENNQHEDTLDGTELVSVQCDDNLSLLSVDSVLQNHEDTDVFMERDSDIVDTDRKNERKSEDDTSSNDSSDELDGSKEEVLEDERERAKKQQMRHLVINAILESELSYLSVLKDLCKLKRLLQNVAMSSQTLIPLEDVTTIFYKVEDIYKHHQDFVKELEFKVENWSDEQKIGQIFKMLVMYFPMYIEYMNNYQTSVETINRCCQESSDFQNIAMATPVGAEVASLEEILFKPVQRIQKNTFVLHDLLQYTPQDHPDHEELTKALTLCEKNLKEFSSQLHRCMKAEESHHLMKSGFIVEMVNHTRKLRSLFLFNDVIICTKHKSSGKNRGTFECKWFIPLSQLKYGSLTEKQEEKAYSCKENTNELKRKIVRLKSELRLAMKLREGSPKDRAWSLAAKKTARGIERLKKRIAEQEGDLVLASPHLPFRLYSDEDRPYIFLLSTDFEREEWREAVQTQMKKLQGQQHQASMNIHDVQEILQNCKQLPEVNSIGTVLMKKDEEMLSGSLNVTIHQLNGLEIPCDTYCCLELDSYGHFFMKARTTVCRESTNPFWGMDFELDLDGSQTLRILCYQVGSESSGDVLLGRSALELSRAWLKDSFCEKTISMNEISLIVSIRHTSTSRTMKRTPSKHSSGIFGVKLENVTRREGKTVPSIVTTCVQEIEKRGLDEVGLYRVSGVTSDVQRLKKLFDKNPRAAANLLGEIDINAVTGVLKLYFRELPEPLFTNEQYRSFIDTIGLSDLEAKEKCMLQLLHSLPDANYYTVVYTTEHLVRVSKHCEENKMTLNNLSTIFGPTLLHPAVRDSMMSLAELMDKGAQEVFSQSGVVFYLLNLAASGKNIHRCSAI